MKFEYNIYVITDSEGNKFAAVAEEGCDGIMISGPKNWEKYPQHFEDNAYHLEDWARYHGFDYDVIKKAEEI